MEDVKKENFKLREDLNDMVSNIKLISRKTSFGVVNECIVRLFNDEEIIFRDKNKLYDLLRSFIITGQTGYIKSKKLVDEFKTDEEGNVTGVYTCVKYELTNGEVYRLFPKDYSSVSMIKNYYDFYKKNMKDKDNAKK